MAAKVAGKMPTIDDPAVSEWGNPIDVIINDFCPKYSDLSGLLR